MCGRIIRTSPRDAIVAHFEVEADPALDFAPRYNLSPAEELLAVVAEGGRRGLRAFRWGYTSPNAGFNTKAPRPINARAETAATRPLFRGAFRQRRCLVVADGFYEWKVEPGGKVPHVIRLRSHAPFGIAGLWEGGMESEPATPTALVLTCPPNPLIATLHGRMPVILDGDAAARWLDSGTPVASLPGLLAPYPAEAMEAFAVSRLVNNPRNDAPECLAPDLDPPPRQRSLF